MKKIPLLFKIEYNPEPNVLDQYNDGVDELFIQNCIPYILLDGSSFLVKDGKLYKRYDNKKLKKIEDDWIFCYRDDKHNIYWVPVSSNNVSDKYHCLIDVSKYKDGTYELINRNISGFIETEKPLFLSHTDKRMQWYLDDYKEKMVNPRRFKYFIENVFNDYPFYKGIVFHSTIDDRMFKIRLKDFGIKRIKLEVRNGRLQRSYYE